MKLLKQEATAMNCPFCKRMFYVFGPETFDIGRLVISHACPHCDEIIVENWVKDYHNKANRLLQDEDEDDDDCFFVRLK
jgi:hypothetical protein